MQIYCGLTEKMSALEEITKATMSYFVKNPNERMTGVPIRGKEVNRPTEELIKKIYWIDEIEHLPTFGSKNPIMIKEQKRKNGKEK